LKISLKWRKISNDSDTTIRGGSNSSNQDIDDEGHLVEHAEAFDEDEFTRRVLGDDGMSSGSEDQHDSSPILLNAPQRSPLDDDDEEGTVLHTIDEEDEDGDENIIDSSSSTDDDDVVDLIKESIKPSELHLSDDEVDLEDPHDTVTVDAPPHVTLVSDDDDDDEEIDSDDESELPSVLPLRIRKSGASSPATVSTHVDDDVPSLKIMPTATSTNGEEGGVGEGGEESPTAEELDIITLDKVDEQLTDPTIVHQSSGAD